MWVQKHKHQKFYAILMSFMLILSLFTPQIAIAQEQNNLNLNTPEEDLKLEKKLEEEAESGKHDGGSEKDDQVKFTGEDGLPRLTDGLSVNDPDFSEPSKTAQEGKYNPDNFTLNGKVEKSILQSLKKKDTVNVIIRMKDNQKKSSVLNEAADVSKKTERIKMMREHLKNAADKAQDKVLHNLKKLEQKGQAANIKSLWIINGVVAEVTEQALNSIRKRDDVERVLLDEVYEVPETTVSDAPRLPEWGLEKINATDVWGEYGIDGEGVVVGIMDTGVEGDHEALRHNYRGRDGNHNSSWIDLSGEGYKTPQDGNGHGTHVAGTAVGGGEGEPIGVAPGAEWIAAKIFDDRGYTTESSIHEAFEWFMAPGGDPANAPDVVNNSWGNADTYNMDFYEDVQVWRTAGIFPLFAAGNDGPGSQTIGSPASFIDSFAIGATDINDQIASFSSRGPVYWDGEQYVKPEVSAPGAEIYSAWPGNEYNTISGTSMATPHVAGVIALIMQANPNMTIDEVKELLEGTARAESHMGQLPNNMYGHGIVDSYQAVTEAAFAGEVSGQLVDESGNGIEGQIIIEEEDVNVKTEEDGSFSFKIREGNYDVILQSFGYYSNNQTISVNQGEVTEVTWQLEEAERYDVSGSVTTEDGAPVPYAYLRVQDTPIDVVRTDKNGEYFINELPEGSYTLAITGQGISGKEENIQVNQDINMDISVSESDASSASNWQTLNNNTHRNAISNQDIASDQLEESWAFETRGNIIFSSPAADDQTVVVTTDSGYVHAIDKQTGEEKWRFSTGDLNRSTPTIAEGRVFVAGGQDNTLYALDLETGVVRWQQELNNVSVYETPLYESGTVFLTATISGDTNVIALDAETGAKQWSTTVGEGSYFGAALADGKLFVGTYDDGTLHALSAEDGSELWSFEMESEGFASHPVVVDGTVFAFSSNFDTGSGTLWALDAETGEENWSAEGIGDTQAASPVIYGDMILVSSATNPSLKAFDRQTGTIIWENKDVNTAVNNGAASSNGLFFIIDSTNMLKAVDIFSGNILSQWSLPSFSSSSPAIVAGELIVGTQTGVTAYQAPGMLTGTIEDADGEPVAGTARIPALNLKAEADDNGHFELAVLPGTYDVKITKYGLEQVIEEMTFRSGFTYEKTYELEAVGNGQLSGTVTDERSGDPIEGVTVSVQDSSLETTTNDDGKFVFDDISAGSHNLLIELGGYVEQQVTTDITENERTEVQVDMAPIDVAVLDDYDAAITGLLNQNGIPAEERDWTDIMNDLENYQVLYLNGAYTSDESKPGKEDMDELIELARTKDVSIVFAETWGPSYGSIGNLTAYYDDPSTSQSDYNATNISMVIQQDHPIFGDDEAGERIRVMNNGHASWFNGYSGRNIATVGSQSLGDVGTGIAYKGVSQDSAHFLLSTHAAASWNMPTQHWNEAQHELLVNSVSYLIEEAQYGQFGGQIVDEEGNPLQAKIEVADTGVYETADEDGQFDLYHDEGAFEVNVRLSGYETQTIEVMFKHGDVTTETIELVPSNEGQLTGDVTNALTSGPISNVEVVLLNGNGETVAETITADNGYYELTDLSASDYTVEFRHQDYVLVSEEIEIAGEPVNLNKQLNPAPNVAVIGDQTYGDDHFRAIMDEVNIEAVNYGSTAELTGEIDQYDVVFFNRDSGLDGSDFNTFQDEADKHGVSIIYGSTYFSGGGIEKLVELRGNPSSEETLRIRSSSAQYLISEEHPVFGEAESGETVDILVPSGSRVATFDGYSGFPLADSKHAEFDDPHGPGVAFMPRTGESVELLMGGHGISFGHSGEDYTEAGLRMFTDAVIWAAQENYNVLEGTVTDTEGKPLNAEVKLAIGGTVLNDYTNPDNGKFSVASVDGNAEVTVEAYGYQSQTFGVTINEELSSRSIELEVKEDAGSIEGTVSNSKALDGVEEARINVVGHPRETMTDAQGNFTINALEPGLYDLEITKESFVQKDVTIEIAASETKQLDIEMRPSPTVGIIVDYEGALSDYLEKRGYNVKSMFYDDLDMLDEVDVVFANSDYDNDLNPDKQTFKDFVAALDESKTSVIWTGQHGSRGSIRYLTEYLGDPGTEYHGNESGTMTAEILEDHPIFEGVDDTFEFENQSGYYYGFGDYSGTVLADYDHSELEEEGNMAGFRGRTTDSVEVLLAGMTIGYGFNPSDGDNFDENRERIINNAILWAIDHEESYAGEIHGNVKNDDNQSIQAQVTVEETGRTISTNSEGRFMLGLPEGSYTLQMESFGHSADTFDVTVVNGEVLEESFVLQSENTGELTGQITAASTGESVEGAAIELLDTPLKAETDAEGNYSFVIPEGNYQMRVTASGYQPQTLDVSISAGEAAEMDISLGDSEAIAFIGSSYNQDRVLPFLVSNGYEVTVFDRDEHGIVKENIENFALVIFNDSGTNMSEDDFTGLIDAADEAQVSMIFASQWGNGSISDLQEYLGDPATESDDFVPKAIQYQVLEEHPIFRGFNAGDTFTLVDRGESNQQYAVFDDYSGTTIADVTHADEGRLGGGLAYEFRSSSHVHLLLGSLGISSYGSPDYRWTEDARTVYLNAIDWAMNASLGEITGAVKNENGEPISGATVSVEGEGISDQTNDQGQYTLSVGTGEQTVTAEAVGYESKKETIQVENVGDTVELNFTLVQSEQMALHGQVTDLSTDEGLEEVTVNIVSEDIEQSVVTDADGQYEVAGLLKGDYNVTFNKKGYHPLTKQIKIEDGEDFELNASISAYNVAVLGDYKEELSTLLKDHDMAAESTDWNIIDHVEQYEVIIVNASEGTEEDVETLISKSDEYQTSLIFLDTWGAENGSLHLLEKTLGHPVQDQHGYDEGAVILNAERTDHPIFESFDGEVQILAEKSPYATFKDYQGNVLGGLAVDDEDKGDSIGYEFQSGDHVRLIMSAFAVNNMVGPERGWTEDGEKLFVQAIEWAKSAHLDPPNSPEWKSERERYHEGEVVVEGSADRGVTIRILEDGNLIAETEANGEGVFEANLDLSKGSHKIHAEAINPAGTATTKETMHVIVTPKPRGKPFKE